MPLIATGQQLKLKIKTEKNVQWLKVDVAKY
jgi:hypothetical protein